MSSFVCFCGIFVLCGCQGTYINVSQSLGWFHFLPFLCAQDKNFFLKEHFIMCAIHGMDIDI